MPGWTWTEHSELLLLSMITILNPLRRPNKVVLICYLNLHGAQVHFVEENNNRKSLACANVYAYTVLHSV